MRISEMDIIKYDIKDKKSYFISSVISTAVFVIWIFLLWFETGALARIHIPFILEYIIWVGFWPDCILTVALWMKYLDALFYLRRLKRAGYEIPEDKRVYYQNLRLLPKIENAGHVSPGKNYGSIILTVVTGMIVAGLIVYDIWFFVQYSFVGMDAMWLCEGILCSATFFWLLYGIFFAVQISNKKYKNDVEIDTGRKNRKSLTAGLRNIAGLLALTFLAVWLIKIFIGVLINVRFRGM